MHTNVENQPTPMGRREWLGLLVLVLPSLLVMMDLTVLFLALPKLSEDLLPGSTQQLWIVDIYGFMLAGFLITMGTLGDRVGRRKVLLAGGALFGIASVLAAYSTSPEMLIAARALLGIAGATLAPSTLALITNMFKDPKQRAKAIAVWTSCFMGGSVLGPILGGFMLTWFWWGSVFLLAVPVMVLLLVAGPLVLPEYRNPDAGRLDLSSVGLSLMAVIPFIYGLKETARGGWAPGPVAALVIGAVVGVLFVRRQCRLADPMLDLGLFKISVYRSALVLGLLLGIILGGSLLLINLQLQVVEGLSPLRTGLWLVPGVIGMVLAIMVTTGLARKIRPAYLMAAGFVVSAVGFAVLSQVPSTHGLMTIVVGLFLVSVGVGPTVALGYGMILGSAPPGEDRFGVRVVRNRRRVRRRGRHRHPGHHRRCRLPPPDLGSRRSADRRGDHCPREHRERCGGGTTSGPAADELITSARQAFTSGLNLVGVLAVVVCAALAGLAVLWLRHVPTTPESKPESDVAEPDPARTSTGQ